MSTTRKDVVWEDPGDFFRREAQKPRRKKYPYMDTDSEEDPRLLPKKSSSSTKKHTSSSRREKSSRSQKAEPEIMVKMDHELMPAADYMARIRRSGSKGEHTGYSPEATFTSQFPNPSNWRQPESTKSTDPEPSFTSQFPNPSGWQAESTKLPDPEPNSTSQFPNPSGWQPESAKLTGLDPLPTAGLQEAVSELPRPAPTSIPKTYRVRGVPLAWDKANLASFLRACDASFNSEIEDLTTLAREPGGRSQVATMTFDRTPGPLNSVLGSSGICSWTSPGTGAAPRRLTVDDGFIGLTTLHIPPPEDHNLEIIAMSGLGGHAFGSFRAKGSDYMWLRDSLPADIPSARITIYGYDSRVPGSRSLQDVGDLSRRFREDLKRLLGRDEDRPVRPILFIGHSLGGLILEQVIVTLFESQSPDDQDALRSIFGLIWFGVPHSGMNISSLILMVGDAPNRGLVESLSHENSSFLRALAEKFPPALGGKGDSEVFCYYETLESPTAKKTGEVWKMDGPDEILVSPSSATACCRSWESREHYTCGLHRTHSDLVKFAEGDGDYEIVCDKLQAIAARGLAKLNSRGLSDPIKSAEIGSKVSSQGGMSQSLPIRSSSGGKDGRVFKTGARQFERPSDHGHSHDQGTHTTTPLSTTERDRLLGLVRLDSGEAIEPNVRDERGRTPLVNAAEKGDESTVRSLLSSGLIADSLDTKCNNLHGYRNGDTVLSLAVEQGHTNIVQLLLDAGVSDDTLDPKEPSSRSPLILAAGHKEPSMIKLLLDTGRVRVDVLDERHMTPLKIACTLGHLEVVRVLLGTGNADINAKDAYGNTALMRAAAHGYVAIVKLLLENPAMEIDAISYNGSALSLAAQYGYKEIFDLLLATGKADLDKWRSSVPGDPFPSARDLARQKGWLH